MLIVVQLQTNDAAAFGSTMISQEVSVLDSDGSDIDIGSDDMKITEVISLRVSTPGVDNHTELNTNDTEGHNVMLGNSSSEPPPNPMQHTTGPGNTVMEQNTKIHMSLPVLKPEPPQVSQPPQPHWNIMPENSSNEPLSNPIQPTPEPTNVVPQQNLKMHIPHATQVSYPTQPHQPSIKPINTEPLKPKKTPPRSKPKAFDSLSALTQAYKNRSQQLVVKELAKQSPEKFKIKKPVISPKAKDILKPKLSDNTPQAKDPLKPKLSDKEIAEKSGVVIEKEVKVSLESLGNVPKTVRTTRRSSEHARNMITVNIKQEADPDYLLDEESSNSSYSASSSLPSQSEDTAWSGDTFLSKITISPVRVKQEDDPKRPYRCEICPARSVHNNCHVTCQSINLTKSQKIMGGQGYSDIFMRIGMTAGKFIAALAGHISCEK